MQLLSIWFATIFIYVSCLMKGRGQLLRSCPPQENILPCRCLTRGEETQIWCSHSDLPRVMGGLRAIGQYLKQPIDELILENNNLPSLPGRVFLPLNVMRLMLRYNNLERVSGSWLNGLENSLMEIFIVEPELRSLPEESLQYLNKLEAITIQSTVLKYLPNFSNLPRLKYLNIESLALSELLPVYFKNLPSLEKLEISGSAKLTKLEANLIQDLPVLSFVNISYCGINWIHPRAIARLPLLAELSLIGNKITDAGMVGRGMRDLPALEILRLDYNEIERIEEAAFVDLPFLKKLFISNNRIVELQHGAFHRLPKLKILDLNNNMVQRVHPESFLQQSSTGVEELWLMNNKIGHVSELRSILDALPRLLFLEMSNNNLEAIPFGSLRGHPTLERLHLDFNRIHLIDREAFMAMPALLELRMKNNSLSNHLETPLWNLPALKGLDLSGNYFQRIGPHFLENLPSLRKIDLSDNRLMIIDPAAFLNSPLLERINISRNNLAAIHPGTFRNLLNLFELDVSFNRLLEFVPGLPKGIEYVHISDNEINTLPISPSPDLDLPSLRHLDLRRNLLSQIPAGSLSLMSQLRKLYLGQNSLQRLHSNSLQGLIRLEVLDMQQNKINQINPEELRDMKKLKVLNLHKNHLDVIKPEVFISFPGLLKLDLSENRLNEIKIGTLEYIRNLRILNASFNSLSVLPNSLFGMDSLQYLDLTSNKLKIIQPDIINSLTSLIELRLSRNNIKELQTKALSNLQNLQMVYLDENELEKLEPYCISSMPQLKLIKLNGNKLQTISNSVFFELPSLQIVELQSNSLMKIAPRAFESVPQLLMLNLSYNQLENFEEAGLQNIYSLEMLDLSNNKLSLVYGRSLEMMEWLVELRLDNNRICSVHGSTFDGMPRLKILRIRNNLMMSFPEQAIQRLRGNIAVIDIDGNPLACTCSLLWMKVWLQENSLIGPKCIDGILLRDKNLSKFECTREEQFIDPVAPGCESELLSVPPEAYTTSQVFTQYENLRQNVTKQTLNEKNKLAPTPEESEYFYEDYIDYPYNETILQESANVLNDENIQAETSTRKQNLITESPHYVTGDTPTLYAAPSRNKSKVDPPREVSGSPSNSGFTFFGVPLPSINFNNLWGSGKSSEQKVSQTKVAERKAAIVNNPGGNAIRGTISPNNHPEILTGFVPILPGSGGFTPILNSELQQNLSKPQNEINPLETSKFSNVSKTQIFKRDPLTSSMSNYTESTSLPPFSTPAPITSTIRIATEEHFKNKFNNLQENKTIVSNKSEESVVHTHIKNTYNATEILNKTHNTNEIYNSSLVETSGSKSSFKNIFEEISDNTSTLSSTTTSKPVEKGYFNLSTTVAPPELNKVHDFNKSSNLKETKFNETVPTAALLIPGGQQPPFRMQGKPKITKVVSPHFPENEPDKYEASDNDNIFPQAQREGKTGYRDTSIPNNNHNMDEEKEWYFVNYNKTDLKPYISPGLEKFSFGSGYTATMNDFIGFLCILVVSIL